MQPTALLPMLWLTVDAVAAFRGEPVWYRGFDYAVDRARGYDHRGDRWSPGVLELELGPGQSAACKAESFPVSPTNQVFIPNETKDPANQKVFVENCTDGAPWP